MRRILMCLVAVVGVVGLAQQSRADQSTFAGATAFGSSAFTYTGGAGGGLTITPGSTFTGIYTVGGGSVDLNTTLSLTGATNVGTLITANNTFTQDLSGGTFTLTASNGTTVLLAGTFGSATLSTVGPLPESQASFLTDALAVTYTNGSYFAQSGLNNPGGFSFGLTSIVPQVDTSGNYFTSFVAGGSGTFSATTPPASSVPLPSAAALALSVLPGLALWFWLRRKSVITA